MQYVVENDKNPNPSGGLLEVVNATQPENGSCDFSADGYIQYTPSPDFIGTDQCSYFVCIEGTSACDEATLVVDVVEVKIAEADEADTPTNTPILVDVLKNDEYIGDPDKPLVITDIASQPENGSCEVVGDKVQYNPNQDFSGTDQCKYTVCAEDNTEVCDEGTLTVNVIPPKPVANDDEAETPPNTPVLVDVISNDSHPDDLPLETTDITTQPENGICEVIDGKVQYTPNRDFVSQVDSCLYTVCVEGTTSCDEGKVTITVTESPTKRPSPSPTVNQGTPTRQPIITVIESPTKGPSPSPTVKQGNPTRQPIQQPKAQPSGKPTLAVAPPTFKPSGKPTFAVAPSTFKPTKGNTRPFALGQLAPFSLVFITAELTLL